MRKSIDVKQELRRSQNTLAVSGSGLIAFGAWSSLKSVMTVISKRSEVHDIVRKSLKEMSMENDAIVEMIMSFILYGIIFLLVLIIFLLYTYLGRSCISVGRYNKRKFLYIPVSLFLGISFVFSAIYEIFTFSSSFESPLDGFATIIFDFSSAIVLLVVVYSAIRIFILKRRLKEVAYE